MKKQYIFLIMIVIILYLFYLIINYKYKEYKINENIIYITQLNNQLKEGIAKADNIIERKQSKAYINKILKEQQSLKNIGEEVVFLTTEDTYNKYTTEITNTPIITNSIEEEQNNIISTMSIYQKWVYMIFKKDIR